MEQLDICMQKSEVGHLPHIIHKIKVNYKWPETIKHLEENIGETFCDLRLDKNFLDMTAKAYL